MACLGLGFASILVCWIVQFALIDGINSKVSQASRFSFVSREYTRIFREHSRFYPNSKLRALLVVFLVLGLVSIFGFIFVQIIQ
jgi:hypothetical protein